MNSRAAMPFAPYCPPEMNPARLVGRILNIGTNFGLRILAAANAAAGTLTATSRAKEPDAAALASGRADVSAKKRASAAHDIYGRFQRDIVPHLDAAYNFARFLSRNPDAAQDIVQEAYLRAYRGFNGYQGGDARAWIFAIVRNCYHDWLLANRRKARVEIDIHASGDAHDFSIDDVASEEDTPEAVLLRSAESRIIRGVLNDLPRSLREVLVLRELEGLSYRQIAEASALPIGTVMSRLARARAQFESAWRQAMRLQEKST
jgi:RNA polymerase sigma-70 factor (ECF subfamily)